MYPQAIQLYKRALDICDEFGHTKAKVSTHANLSLTYLKQEEFVEAFKEADNCLQLDSKHSKVRE